MTSMPAACRRRIVRGAAGEIARLDGEKSDGVVAPVIGETLLQQMAVLDELVDGQKLDRRHA
jgi:hypothetical protein